MNEPTEQELLRRVSRQLKWTNRLLAFFGALIISGLVILGIVIWQLFMMFQATMAQIQSLRTQASDSVNVQKQVCESDNPVAKYLQQSTDICK